MNGTTQGPEGERPIDVQALTQRAVRRDRRWLWFLGISSVVAWMLVVMAPWATILPMLKKVVVHQIEMEEHGTNPLTAEQQVQSREMLQVVKVGTLATFAGSIVSMFFAAVCSVSLVLLSRRATLRQVNAQLAEISAQIKTLGKTL